MHVAPCGHGQRLPIAERLEAEIEQPFRLTFLMRDQTHDVLIEAARYDVGLHIGREAVFILLVGDLLDKRVLLLV